MTLESSSTAVPLAVTAKPGLRLLVRRTLRGARRNPNMAYGLTIVFLMSLMAILAPLLWTSDPSRPKPTDRFIAPT